jgi:peptidoglycan/xylan/chitin deacetylase (PgdA/CDA1 family)
VSTRVFNLTLHGIGEPCRPLEPGEDAVWLSVAELEKVLDEASTREDVRLTFDDGNKSDTEVVLWELRRRKLTATFFVVAGMLDRDAFLATEDVEAILSAGHAVGSHGMRHRRWHGLDPCVLDEELDTARGILEAVCGRPITELSCPSGSYDRRVLRRARELGYERVFTSDRGPADPRAWLQPRTTIRSSVVQDITRPARADVLVMRATQTLNRWR